MFTLAGHNEPNSRSLSASIDDAVSSCICDADIASKVLHCRSQQVLPSVQKTGSGNAFCLRMSNTLSGGPSSIRLTVTFETVDDKLAIFATNRTGHRDHLYGRLIEARCFLEDSAKVLPALISCAIRSSASTWDSMRLTAFSARAFGRQTTPLRSPIK